MQLLLQFNDEKDQITSEIDRIQEVFWEMLAPALWVFDTVQVDATQRGVVKNNAVVGMAIYPAEGMEPTFVGVVQDGSGREMFYEPEKDPRDVSSEYQGFSKLYVYEYPILYDDEGRTVEVGRATIYSSSAVALGRAEYLLVVTLVSALIKTTALWVIFYLVLKLFVAGPLNRIEHAVNDLSAGEGDLTQRIDSRDQTELGSLAKGVNGFIGKLQGFVANIFTTAEKLEKNAEESTTVANTSKSAFIDQKSLLDELFSRMASISNRSGVINESTQEIAKLSDSVKDVSSSTAATIGNAVSHIQSLADEVESSSALVQELSNESNNIGAIIDSIQSIAAQTNLLALNAAIEAARAGESGRGFAVVADEVRTLAARTQEATDDIQKIITKVLDITSNVSQKMASNQENSKVSAEAASKVQSSFESITDYINNINEKVSGISSHISATNDDASEINNNIGQANDITARCQRHAEEISDLNKSLFSLATELRGEMSHFKV